MSVSAALEPGSDQTISQEAPRYMRSRHRPHSTFSAPGVVGVPTELLRLPRRGAKGRGRPVGLVAALLAATFAVLMVPSAAQAVSVDPADGPLYADGVVRFSGTCASDPGVDYLDVDLTFSDPAYDRTGIARVDGTTWTAASGSLDSDEALTMTATIDCGDGAGPASRTFDLLAPSLDLVLTVGTEAGVCATTTSIEVSAGTPVFWCYTATSLSGREFNDEVLEDDVDGTILEYAMNGMTAGGTLDTVSLGIELTDTPDADMTRTGTWTVLACDGACYRSLDATATATVTVVAEGSTTTTTEDPAEPAPAESPATPAEPATPVVATPNFTG